MPKLKLADEGAAPDAITAPATMPIEADPAPQATIEPKTGSAVATGPTTDLGGAGGPMIVLSPHVPVAASLENTMSQSLITIRQAINDETAAMNGSQDVTRKKIEAITVKARREIQELEEAQAEADLAHSKRLDDLRIAEDMLTKGLEPAEAARAARIAKEHATQEQRDDQQS